MTMVRTRLLRPLLVVVAFAGTVAACGGSAVGEEDGDDVASIESPGTADEGEEDDGDGDVTDADRQDAAVEFAQCMRDHGVDMPDPEVDEDGGITVRAGGPGSRAGAGGVGGPGASPVDEEAFAKADEACRHIMEDVFGEPEPLSPEEEAEMRDSALDFAQCMRDHGIDMPDPEFEEGGGMRMRVGGPGLDPDDADFEAAHEACEPLMGDGPGRFGASEEEE